MPYSQQKNQSVKEEMTFKEAVIIKLASMERDSRLLTHREWQLMHKANQKLFKHLPDIFDRLAPPLEGE